jgi:hypothetical protein
MRRTSVFASTLAFAFATASLLAARPAHAAVLSACGNLDATASSNCVLETSGGCTAQCTPINFEASCAAQLETMCSGGCTATADVNCTGSCDANCSASCSGGSAPSFDCQGSCEADCEGNCMGQCSSSGNMSECQASCTASCGGHCNVACTATGGQAPTCMGQCMASCQGSCTAQANLSCDISCQSSGYVSCQDMLTGGCMAQCSAPMGALFCDGQYVDVGNHVQSCLDELKNSLNINVMASGSAMCSGNTCTAKAAVSCDTSNQEAPLPGTLLLLGVGAVVAGAMRRRSR